MIISVFIGNYLYVYLSQPSRYTKSSALHTIWNRTENKTTLAKMVVMAEKGSPADPRKKDEKPKCKHSSTIVFFSLILALLLILSWIMLYDPYGDYDWIPSPCYRFVARFMCINAIFILVSQSYLSFLSIFIHIDKLHETYTHQSQV